MTLVASGSPGKTWGLFQSPLFPPPMDLHQNAESREPSGQAAKKLGDALCNWRINVAQLSRKSSHDFMYHDSRLASIVGISFPSNTVLEPVLDLRVTLYNFRIFTIPQCPTIPNPANMQPRRGEGYPMIGSDHLGRQRLLLDRQRFPSRGQMCPPVTGELDENVLSLSCWSGVSRRILEIGVTLGIKVKSTLDQHPATVL